MSFCREFIILPDAHIKSFDTYFNLSPIYNLYVLFVKISYQARFCLQISYHASLFTMLIGFLNCGSFIIHALLPGISRACTLSVFLLAACVHVLLPGTRRFVVFESPIDIPANYFVVDVGSLQYFDHNDLNCTFFKHSRKNTELRSLFVKYIELILTILQIPHNISQMQKLRMQKLCISLR